MADDFTLEPLPPEHAIRALRARGVKFSPTFDYRDMWQRAHATAFTVAKSTGFDILNDIYRAVDDALAKGTPFEDFKARLTPLLQAKGWWGKQKMIDPKTGVETLAQLGSERRLRVILDTNLRVAQAAGDWARFQETKTTRPYLWYVAVLDERTRPQHATWHNTVLPIDDPWWETHFPPNDWGCRCIAQSVSEADLERYDLKVSDEPPPSKAKPFVNPRTGAVVQVPEGIAPPFAYNPGQASIDENAARLFFEKATTIPPEVTAKITRVSADVVVPPMASEFEAWSSKILKEAEAARSARVKPKAEIKGKGDIRAVGVLSETILARLGRAGLNPASGVIAIQDHEIIRMVRDNKPDLLSDDDITQLPWLLRNPKAIIFEKTSGALHYVWDHPDRPGWVGKVVVNPVFIDRLRLGGIRLKSPVNSIRSGRYVSFKDFFKPGDMEVVEGEI